MASSLKSMPAELQNLYGKLFPGQPGYQLFCFIRDVIIDSEAFRAKVNEIAGDAIAEAVEAEVEDLREEMAELKAQLDSLKAQTEDREPIVIDPADVEPVEPKAVAKTKAKDSKPKNGKGKGKKATTDLGALGAFLRREGE